MSPIKNRFGLSRRACCKDSSCRFHGTLSCIGGEASLQTVGEVRSALRARARAATVAAADASAAVAENADWEDAIICVGGRQLPQDGTVELTRLELDPNGEVGSLFVAQGPNRPFRCCPDAAIKTEGTTPELNLGERFLSMWLLLAVGIGVAVGQIPHIDHVFMLLKVGNSNLLVAGGMIALLLPPFAGIRYNELGQTVWKLPKLVGLLSIMTNWIVGPSLMLGLGLATLHDYGELLQGVLFVGAARCIAMVLIWNGFAGGDQVLCVSLVLLNSVLTVFLYAPVVAAMAVVARMAGVTLASEVAFGTIFQNVAVYLVIPLSLGLALWLCGHHHPAYETKVLPALSHMGLLALLWTVTWMFAEMSGPLLEGAVPIGLVSLVLIPLVTYFAIMFGVTWLLARKLCGFSREQALALAFTAASNNFELALAATVAIFGADSMQAVATLMGPVSEIPIMLLMVKVAKCLR